MEGTDSIDTIVTTSSKH